MPLPPRRSTVEEWMDYKRPTNERMVKFEFWLRHQLTDRLVWPADEATAKKQIGQCQRFVNLFLCDLNRRGWLFDGPILARIIVEKLDDVARRQKLGAVEDLWIYLRSVWSNYADAASGKFHKEAMSAGFHISKVMAGLKTIPTATAERMEQISTEKLALARRKLAKEKSDQDQASLFSGAID